MHIDPSIRTSENRRIEVVGLVTSAGGLEAVSAVLRGLPDDFPAAIVVVQYLGSQGTQLAKILSRRSRAVFPHGCRVVRLRAPPFTEKVRSCLLVANLLDDAGIILRATIPIGGR